MILAVSGPSKALHPNAYRPLFLPEAWIRYGSPMVAHTKRPDHPQGAQPAARVRAHCALLQGKLLLLWHPQKEHKLAAGRPRRKAGPSSDSPWQCQYVLQFGSAPSPSLGTLISQQHHRSDERCSFQTAAQCRSCSPSVASRVCESSAYPRTGY